jgi:lysophospholipase L1-like esterase
VTAAREDTWPTAYAALGDSFTAGFGCAPGEGFADLLADRFRKNHGALRYTNLAVDGARSRVVAGQVDAAIEFGPDLITVACGGNDVLFTVRPDVAGYETTLGNIFDRLRTACPNARIATATAPERWMFLARSTRTRERLERGIAQLNQVTRQVAESHGVACLELAEHGSLSEPQTFLDDGLHPSAITHAAIAAAFERLLTAPSLQS